MIAPAARRATGPTDRAARRTLLALRSLLGRVNAVLMAISATAAAAAACVLTWEVLGRYLFMIPSDWQDEVSVFLLIGATFLSAAWIQARRGHVAIDTLRLLLPAAADRIRRFLADLLSLAFCGFFFWRCALLLAEAVAEGETSDSAWGPPLWIPYGLMTLGMAALVMQLLLQLAGHIVPPQSR
ncbi:MAG: TRAP transporter small permease [Alphaproteobacteria bacterium]|nr:TRAP transporter small permease [Alphaproteobacteria bacterium]